MKWIIAVLVLLLVTTNILWFLYFALDNAVSASYARDTAAKQDAMRRQLQAFVLDLAQEKKKAEIIAIAKRSTGEAGFEKEGCSYFGKLGFKFGPEDQLLSFSQPWVRQEAKSCH
jgi:hypothetical protein